MTVSIVIPCYNYAQYLPAAIRSAMIQSYPCEIIVVDDGSTDQTMDVGTSYGQAVKYIYQPNMGLPAARNAGIACATGELILCLDADDKLHPKCVEKMVKRYYDGVGIIQVGMRYFGQQHGEFLPNPDVTADDLYRANQIYVTSMFPKKVWQEVGGYDEKMTDGYEDWDFWYRIMALEYSLEVIPEILFFYRKHGKSMIDTAVKNHEKNVKYMREKWNT